MQLTPKTASVVPPEDGRLTPETCRGLRHNKVIVKAKSVLTFNLLMTTIVAPLSNASKWQMGFNSAFKGMHEKPTNTPIIHSVY